MDQSYWWFSLAVNFIVLCRNHANLPAHQILIVGQTSQQDVKHKGTVWRYNIREYRVWKINWLQ